MNDSNDEYNWINFDNPDECDTNVTLCCANPQCGDTHCSGWYVLDTKKLNGLGGEKLTFCSAECVCEYLGIPFYNDDEIDPDSL